MSSSIWGNVTLVYSSVGITSQKSGAMHVNLFWGRCQVAKYSASS